MSQLNANPSFKTPPSGVIPIIQHLVSVYKVWHELRNSFPKKSRYTLGAKIEILFLETLEFLFIAATVSRIQKYPVLQKASGKLDLLKFFLQLAWDTKALDNRKYIVLSESLNEVGKMLGGWMRSTEKETPAQQH